MQIMLTKILTTFSVFLMILLNFTTAIWAAPKADETVSLKSAATQPIILNQTSVQGIPMTDEPQNNWPAIVSKAAVVMDMNTGTVVYAKDPLVRHYPASITKILTAMLALKLGHLNDELVTSKLAASQVPSNLDLQPGETDSLDKLLYGLLLHSGNDAAVVIAERYGGSVKGFSTLMNNEAHTLGAVHSHFDNPNGLPDVNHWTTAYDMAVIARAAMQIPEFRQIVRTKTYNWHGKLWNTRLINLNRLLFNYKGAIGIKTGYTLASEETIVVAATRGNQTFLTVLLDAPLSWQIRSDATTLLNYAFSHYATLTLVSQGKVQSEKRGLPHRLIAQTTRAVLATVATHSRFTEAYFVKWHHINQSEPKGAIVGDLNLEVRTMVPAQSRRFARAVVPLAISKPYVVKTASISALAFASTAIAAVLGTGGLILILRRRPRTANRKAASFNQNYRQA